MGMRLRAPEPGYPGRPRVGQLAPGEQLAVHLQWPRSGKTVAVTLAPMPPGGKHDRGKDERDKGQNDQCCPRGFRHALLSLPGAGH